MRSFLEQADVARKAAAGIRRHMTGLDGSDMAETLKRSDRLDAQGAELEYRWLALTSEPEERPSGWRAWLPPWRKDG
jgi:hypothetical protein